MCVYIHEYIYTRIYLTCDTPVGVNGALRDLNGLACGIDHEPRIRVDSVAISDADTGAAAVTYDKHNARVRYGYERESETRRNTVNGNEPYAYGMGMGGGGTEWSRRAVSKKFRVKKYNQNKCRKLFGALLFLQGRETATLPSFDQEKFPTCIKYRRVTSTVPGNYTWPAHCYY